SNSSASVEFAAALLAAPLARPALGTNTAGTGPNHFVAAAMRADNVHEHVPERFLDAVSVAAPVSGDLRFAVVWRVTRDHIQNFFFAGPRQIRDRTVERFLFHLRNFFHRQLALSAAR